MFLYFLDIWSLLPVIFPYTCICVCVCVCVCVYRDHDFQKIILLSKNQLNLLFDYLSVLVRNSLSQKCLQIIPIDDKKIQKCLFCQIFYRLIIDWLTDWFTDLVMPSDKHNLITTKVMGLVFALLDVALSQDVPFCQPHQLQCLYHWFTKAYLCSLCVPFISPLLHYSLHEMLPQEFEKLEAKRVVMPVMNWHTHFKLMTSVHFDDQTFCIFHNGCIDCRDAFILSVLRF